MIDQIPGLIFHQNQFGHILARLLREPLLPHNRHRLWPPDDRHKLSSEKIPSLRLIVSAHGFKIFFRDDTFHSVGEISRVLLMVYFRLSIIGSATARISTSDLSVSVIVPPSTTCGVLISRRSAV